MFVPLATLARVPDSSLMVVPAMVHEAPPYVPDVGTSLLPPADGWRTADTIAVVPNSSAPEMWMVFPLEWLMFTSLAATKAAWMSMIPLCHWANWAMVRTACGSAPWVGSITYPTARIMNIQLA